jgi:hypothetical protein
MLVVYSRDMAAVARELGVKALVYMSQMTVCQMSFQNIEPSVSTAFAQR